MRGFTISYNTIEGCIQIKREVFFAGNINSGRSFSGSYMYILFFKLAGKDLQRKLF